MTQTQTYGLPIAAVRKALHTAEVIARQFDPETEAKLREIAGPAKWAEVEAHAAEYAATIPGLLAELAELEALACSRCSGTGLYGGPTGHTDRKGNPVCFACLGSGRRRS